MASVSLLLFAAARVAAGTATTSAEGVILDDVLADARERFGAEFAAVLDGSRVWINGDEPSHGGATALADGDEVAVLPPVSGG
jgi:molybdopterin synthase sulfur carrier subunit